MSALTLRLAVPGDIPALMYFWHEHWITDHLMSRDADFFEWQYREGARLNMVIAEQQGTLAGFLGFIPSSRFDPAVDEASQLITLAGWRVKEGSPPGLGVALLAHLRRHLPHGAIATLGLNVDVEQIYKRLGFETGRMCHGVLPNPHKTAFRLAHFTAPLQTPPHGTRTLRRVSLQDLFSLRCLTKSAAFLKARYMDHPRYAYALFAVEERGTPQGILVLRRVETEGASALRLIDMSGPDDLLEGAAGALLALMAANDAEYTDVFSYGLSGENLTRAGFADVEETGARVPNHFEPFVAENRPIPYAVLNPQRLPLRLFKGDGDQDRPNRMDPPRLEIREPVPV
ncbi:N-acetyltransferase family protein [Tepidicaulis sp. LMO-SS28]|uniref:GNAT family N-acetyltransferase n=1 Tax=Tepidicaulis sp. LMO-SS28 TaxID=3447455 RepID=UPI003EE11837